MNANGYSGIRGDDQVSDITAVNSISPASDSDNPDLENKHGAKSLAGRGGCLQTSFSITREAAGTAAAAGTECGRIKLLGCNLYKKPSSDKAG